MNMLLLFSGLTMTLLALAEFVRESAAPELEIKNSLQVYFNLTLKAKS
jgi:hypothetical protein